MEVENHVAMSLRDRAEIQEESLARHLNWIRAVDSKVSVLLAMSTTMLGALAALTPPLFSLGAVRLLCLIAAAGTLCLVQLCCLLATFPRTQGPDGSLLFFGTVAGRTRPQYIADEQQQTDWQYLQDLLTQVHRNAEIASLKYRWVRRGYMWLFASTVPWIINIHFFA